MALDFARPTFAYLDPGTGSIMLQLLLGGVAGGLVVIKLYWHKLKGVFNLRWRRREPASKRERPR